MFQEEKRKSRTNLNIGEETYRRFVRSSNETEIGVGKLNASRTWISTSRVIRCKVRIFL